MATAHRADDVRNRRIHIFAIRLAMLKFMSLVALLLGR